MSKNKHIIWQKKDNERFISNFLNTKLAEGTSAQHKKWASHLDTKDTGNDRDFICDSDMLQ